MTTTARKTAVRAVKAEAVSDGTVTVVYAGHKYTVDEDCIRDIDFLEAYEDGKIISALRGALGTEQWDEFKASKAKVLDRDFIDLANEFFKALGATPEK